MNKENFLHNSSREKYILQINILIPEKDGEIGTDENDILISSLLKETKKYETNEWKTLAKRLQIPMKMQISNQRNTNTKPN